MSYYGFAISKDKDGIVVICPSAELTQIEDKYYYKFAGKDELIYVSVSKEGLFSFTKYCAKDMEINKKFNLMPGEVIILTNQDKEKINCFVEGLLTSFRIMGEEEIGMFV